MKATLLALTLLAGTVPAFAVAVVPSTLTQWTFETSVPSKAGVFAPEIGAGSALGYHASSTYSSPAGNGSTHSFSSNTWVVGDYYQFQTSTTGFSGISISWDQTGSSTGPKDFKLQYSTDGSSWSDYTLYSVLLNGTPNSPWSTTGSRNAAFTFSQDLSELTVLDNQASVFFRLTDNSAVALNGLPVAAGGTDRVDNFTVTAAIPEPSTYALLAGMIGFGAVLLRRRRVAA